MDNPHKHETNANFALARRIKQVMHDRETQAERTRILAGKGNAGKAPDIVITATGRSPVFIEAKWMDVSEHLVEEQAREHVGQRIDGQPHKIEAAIALRYPNRIATANDIDEELKKAKDLEYCAVYPKGKRFPTTGWLTGSVCDLADLIHLVDVPETAFQKCAENLEKNITLAANQIPVPSKLNEGEIHEIFKRLGLTEDPKAKEASQYERRKKKRDQTARISGAIIVNALLFQERIAGHPDYQSLGIPLIHDIGGKFAENRKSKALAAWRKILDINYWPIFDAAIQIISILSAKQAGDVLKKLTEAAERIHEDGLLYENDLTGHVFQKLIVDRKYLAAFYTLPTSAALLANLAVAKMKDVDWSDPQAISKLKIADFACGTGALLSAVYDQIANRHERTGGKAEKLHKALMENVFYGFDVVHYATCLTASILSGKQPGIAYNDTNFGTMPYGRQSDGAVKLGSLEFLEVSDQGIMFYTGDPAKAIHGKRKNRRRLSVKNNDLNLVIMNPPFTCPTNHSGENLADIINPAVAAFGTSDLDMDEMGDRLKTLGKGTCYHGNAGLASAFAAVADKKLQPGGVIALVLPLSVASGLSWKGLRTLLAKHYEAVEIVSLATPKSYDVAFSADTSMADCLVIARKKSDSIPSRSDNPTRFVSLHQRPQYLAAAGETARELIAKKTERGLEDGPFGGEDIDCGSEKMGEAIMANLPRTNPKWNAVRIHDFELVQTACQLTQGKLWLSAHKAKLIEMTTMESISWIGIGERDALGKPPRAPFIKTNALPKPTDTYPALWNHNAKKETQLICEPDCSLKVRPGLEEKANKVLKTASRSHFNGLFTLGSQPLAVAFTKEPCIGGPAWSSINFDKKDWDYAFSIWMNSTLGLISCWWHGSRQQPGRYRISRDSIKTLPVLDFRALDKEQIKQAKAIFDEFQNKHFLPAYVADKDKTRALLDERVLCHWLGFDEKVWKAVRQLARKWCAEPSVHGGKQRSQNTPL